MVGAAAAFPLFAPSRLRAIPGRRSWLVRRWNPERRKFALALKLVVDLSSLPLPPSYDVRCLVVRLALSVGSWVCATAEFAFGCAGVTLLGVL